MGRGEGERKKMEQVGKDTSGYSDHMICDMTRKVFNRFQIDNGSINYIEVMVVTPK